MPLPFPFTVYGASRSSAPTDDCFTYCYGGAWVEGKVGKYALDFDGDNDYLTTPNATDIDFDHDDPFTVACWINCDSTSGMIYSKNLGSADNYRGWNTNLISGKVYAWFGNTWTTNGYYINTTSAVVSADTWHHLVVVFNGTTALIYIDGDSKSLTTTYNSLSATMTNTAALEIGTRTAATPTEFDGTIDEFAVWDVALTSAQVTALYDSGNGARADSVTPPMATVDTAWITGTTGSAEVGNITSTYALEFDGSDDYVDVSTSAADWRGLANFSFACWYWVDSYPTTNLATPPTFFSIGSSGNASRINFHFQGHALAYLQKGFIINMYGGSGGTGAAYGSHYAWIGNLATHPLQRPAQTGQWNHLAVSYTGGGSTSAEIVQIWVNGIKHYADNSNGQWASAPNSSISTPTYLYNTIGTTFSTSNIGRSEQNNGYFDGKTDQLAVWDVNITETDVLNLFSGTLAPSALSASDQIAYWSMDEDGPGSVNLVDSSTNNYDGTLTNMGVGATGSLLLYYDFEIGDNNPVSGNFPGNSTVYDVTTAAFHPPTAHTGTMTNMSVADFGDWDQGKVGVYSLDFDGTNDYVTAGTDINGDFTQNLTVAAWIKPGLAGVNNHVIAGQWDWGASKRGWYCRLIDSTGRIEIGATRNGTWTTPYLAAASTTALSADTWYHVVAVYDCSTSPATPKIYINGSAETLSSNTSTGVNFDIGGNISGGNVALTLGAYFNNSSPEEHFDGNIDEVSLWSGELTSGEVTSLYNSGVGAKATSITPSSAVLITYYDMECNGPGSTTVKGQSSYENDGTMTNMSAGTCGSG